MKYAYYKAKNGNFGDDLNGWLWPKIFKDVQTDLTTNFLGIGSMLSNESSIIKALQGEKKIIFGSGVRPSTSYTPFKADHLTDIRFLRGPLSALAFDNKYEYITDAAYAIRHTEEFKEICNQEKKYEISVMPYFHSVSFFDWKDICDELGYHYISPLCEQGIEHTLHEIASSRLLISEAMHGAIVADILRVPWHRFVLSTPHTEGELVSQFKWTDWLHSIQIYNPQVSFIPFYRKTRMHNWIKLITNRSISTEFLFKSHVKREIINNLSSKKEYYLSDDQLLKEIDDRIQSKIDQLKVENIQ